MSEDTPSAVDRVRVGLTPKLPSLMSKAKVELTTKLPSLMDSKPPSFRKEPPEPPKKIQVSVPVESKQRRLGDKAQPFMPNLGEDESGYFVTVSEGRVVERTVTELAGSNQVAWIKPEGIVDAENLPIRHPIQPNEAVYIQFSVDNKGNITGDPSVAVESNDHDTASFYPMVGDFAGQSGTYYYKLAQFRLEGTREILELFHAGDHIHHYAERTEMVNLPLTIPEESGDYYQLLKTYLMSLDQIQFRSLRSLLVEDGASLIKDQDGDTVNFRRIAPKTSPFQIQVTEDEDAIRVEGNGVSGDNDAVTVEDGLVTTVKAFEMCNGDTFAVAYWSCLIEIQFEPPDNYYIYVERTGTTPDYVVYYFEGCAYLNTPPEGYPVFSTDPYPVINVPLYNLLDLGVFPDPPYTV